MKSKFMKVAAIAALCVAFAFALTACAKTEDRLTEKLAEKDATFTVTSTLTDIATGEVEYSETARVNGAQIYTKSCKYYDTQAQVVYFGIIQDGEKYYRIEGTDEKLIKSEISKDEFGNLNVVYAMGYNKYKSALEDYKTYFEESGDVYKLKVDKILDFFNIGLPEEEQRTELFPGEENGYKSIEVKFENDKITMTTILPNNQLITLVFSEIGSTKFEPFTDTVPTLEA